MGKGTIISHEGDGLYQVQLNFHGASRIDAKIAELENMIDDIDDQIALLPDGTEKNILKLKKASLEKYVDWYEVQKIEDITIYAWCSDLTEDLSGEVGMIEVPNERQYINIRPGYNNEADYNQNRDGQIQPVIASGPATSFLNLSIFPGWQKWKPTYRYAHIITGSIDYEMSTCDIIIDPSFSTQKSINVNQGTVFIDYMDEEDYEYKIYPAVSPEGFRTFCENNPTHPT